MPAIIVLLGFGLLPLALPGLKIPLDPYGTVWTGLGMVSAAYMSGRSARHPGHARGPDRGRPVARHAERDGDAQDRPAPGVPHRHAAVDQRGVLLTKDSSLVYVLGLTASTFDLAEVPAAT